MKFVLHGTQILQPQDKLLCTIVQRGEKNPSLSHLSCLEVMPFCGFNTQPNHCALVSPAISSNLATLNWIFVQRPQCVMRKTYPAQRTKGLFRYSCILDSSGPHLTNRDCRGTFHFLLAMGKRSIPRGGWLPSLSPLLPCDHSSTTANVLDSSYRAISQ